MGTWIAGSGSGSTPGTVTEAPAGAHDVGHALPFWTRHQGPYVLHLSRRTKAGAWEGQKFNAKEYNHGADAEAAARDMLSDGAAEFVNVWSVSEDAYVGGYRK